MNEEYIVDNLKSEYFGISGHQLENWYDAHLNVTWIKLLFDYVDNNGNISEQQLWFKEQELVLKYQEESVYEQ